MDDTSQTIYCTDCETELSADDSFCSSCGASVDPDTETEQNSQQHTDELLKAASKATENSKV